MGAKGANYLRHHICVSFVQKKIKNVQKKEPKFEKKYKWVLEIVHNRVLPLLKVLKKMPLKFIPPQKVLKRVPKKGLKKVQKKCK